MQKPMQAFSTRTAGLRVKTLTAAVLTALVTANAAAVGLGKLTVLSGLGQPLRAEIELTAVTPDEARTLQPKLASVDAFRQANVEFNTMLQTLRFAIEQRGSRHFIRVTSPQAITEPFVDVLLELSSVNGRLIREYTMLLDPPEMRAVQPAQAAPISAPPVVAATQTAPAAAGATAAASAPAARPAGDIISPAENTNAATRREATVRPQVATRATRPARDKAAVAARAPNGNSPGAEYKVQSGDSLSRIATRAKPEGISLDQMLVALYRANPDAFVGNNMNRLRAGQILTIPAGEASAAVGAPEAHGIVVAQAADFSDYRNKLAGQVASGGAQKAGAGRQSASGKIAARVDERPTAASESPDKLKLSKADSAAAGKAAAVQEEKIAREKAAAESTSRVKDLEKNVTDLQKLLEVKNKDLSERQRNADAAKAAVAGSTDISAAPAPVAKTAPAAVVKTDPAPAATPVPATASTSAGPAVTSAPVAVVAAPVEAAAPVVPIAPVVPVVPAPEAGAEPAATSVAQSPSKPKTPKVAQPAPMPAIYEDPLVQGLAGLLALLLGVLMFKRSRARKQTSAFNDTAAAADTGPKTNNSLFGSPGGQSVDTNNSVFNSGFVPSASNLDSNEVDPVAEADVYIAYGRDVQAEEILKEALRTHPERHAVRVKLLEIYASRKDTRAFENVATELYSLCKGEGDDWGQAASMGLALDPLNPLYAGATATATPAAHETAALAPAPGLDKHADLDAFLDGVSAAHPFVHPAAPAATLAAVPAVALATSLEATTAKPAETPSPLAGNLMEFEAAAPVVPVASAASAASAASPVLSVSPALPVHPTASTVVPPADNSLDFDLDGLDFNSIGKLPGETVAGAPAAPVASTAPGAHTLPVAPTAPASAVVVPLHANDLPLSASDFDFLNDAPSLPVTPATAGVTPAAPTEFNLAPADSASLPTHVPPAAVPPLPSLPPLPSITPLAEVPPAPPTLPAAPALAPSAATSTTPARPEPLEFDLSGITLDLPDNGPHGAPAFGGRPVHGSSGSNSSGNNRAQEDFTELDLDVATADDGASLSGISNTAEMATKLDLALAYQEIGDQDGARELLEEVMKGGSSVQSDKARSLLAKLS